MTHAFPWLVRSAPPIGIEIGATVVRLVQLDSSRTDAIRRAVSVPLVDGRIDAVAMRRAARGFAGRDAVVAPPRGTLVVRPARLPMLEGEELREAARWEAAAQLDRDGADVVAEPIVVGRGPGDDGRLEMLLVAGGASEIEAALTPVLDAGLRPVAVEPAFLAAGRAHALRSRRDSEREVVRVVVDVAGDDSWIVLMRGDGVVFAKQVPVGGRAFDAAIARDLGIDEDEATRTRAASCGDGADGLVRGAVSETVRRTSATLADEVSMAVRYATVAARLGRPVSLHLSGEAGATPGLEDAVGRAVPGLAVERDRTLESRLATIASRVGETGIGAAWATPLGLALRPSVAGREAA